MVIGKAGRGKGRRGREGEKGRGTKRRLGERKKIDDTAGLMKRKSKKRREIFITRKPEKKETKDAGEIKRRFRKLHVSKRDGRERSKIKA